MPSISKLYFLDGDFASWEAFYARMWLAAFGNLNRRQRRLLRKGINPY